MHPSEAHDLIYGHGGIYARIARLEWELVSRYKGSRWRKHLVKVLDARVCKLEALIERG